MKSKVAIIILNYNDKKNSIRLAKELNDYNIIDKIIVVDNCSPNNDFEYLKEIKNDKIDVIKSDKNGGYSYGNNYALKYLEDNFPKFEYIIISNPDIEVEEDAIIKTIDYLSSNDDIAIAAPRIVDQKGNKYILSGWKIRKIWDDIFLQSKITTKFFVNNPWERMYDEEYRDKEYSVCGCVSGAFFVIKSEIFKKINYFDDKVFLFGEEDIIGKQVHDLGYKACVLNNCSVVHYESVSINKCYDMPQKMKILYSSLRHYYKKYDENVGIFTLLLFDIVYYFGIIERFFANITNKIIFLRKFKSLIKIIYHKIITPSRFKKIDIDIKNSKKNILFITNYWEEDLQDRKNIGLQSWLINDIIKNNQNGYNYIVFYSLGYTYRITCYVDGKVKTYVVGFCNNKIKVKNNYYNYILKKLIKKFNVDIIQLNTIINHSPSFVNLLNKLNVKLIVPVLDLQLLNPNYMFDNLNSNSKKSINNNICKKWRKEVQKLFDLSDKVIFSNKYTSDIYHEQFRFENDKIDSCMMLGSKKSDYNCKLKEVLNVGFIGCILDVQEIKLVTKLIDYCNKRKLNVNFYFLGNTNFLKNDYYDNVKFVGEYNRNDLFSLIAKNEINLMCFFKKNKLVFLRSFYETLLANIPIITYDNGFFGHEVRKNALGYVLSNGSDYKHIYLKFKEIINDVGKYNRIKKNIMRFNNKNKYDVSHFYKLYDEVCNEKK